MKVWFFKRLFEALDRIEYIFMGMADWAQMHYLDAMDERDWREGE